MFCGNLASIVSHWKRSKNVRMGSGGVWSIAGNYNTKLKTKAKMSCKDQKKAQIQKCQKYQDIKGQS